MKFPKEGPSSNRFFENMLFSHIFTVAATILVLSTILYVNFEKIAVSRIYSSTRDNLIQASYSANFMIKTAKALSSQIYYDTSVCKLLLYSKLDQMEINECLNQLDNYRYSNLSFIHSIYIYNSSLKTFFMTFPSNTSPMQEESLFFDRGATDIINHYNTYRRFSVIPRQVPFLKEWKSSVIMSPFVYTFVFNESSSGSRSDSAVMLNISEEWMQDILESLNINRNALTLVINQEGQLVINSSRNKMLSDVSGEDFVRKVLQNDLSAGYFVDSVDGVKSLVTFVSSSDLNWRFIQVTDYDGIIEEVTDMKRKTVMFSAGLLLCGLLVSYFLSRKVYNPINSIIEKNKKLLKEKEQNFYILKQDFLKNLLSSSGRIATTAFREKLKELNILFDPEKPFFIILIKIDFFSDFCTKHNNEERKLFKFVMMDLAAGICSSYFKNNEAVNSGEDNIALLINYDTDNIYSFNESIKGMTEKIRAEIKKSVDISVSFTISESAGPYEHIGSVYDRTLDASSYRLIYGHGCSILVKNIHKLDSADYVYPAGKEKILLDAITLGKYYEAEKHLNEILLEATEYSYTVLNLVLIKLAFAINITVENIAKRSGTPRLLDFNAFIAELNRLETLEEIKKHFYKVFHNLSSGLEEKKGFKHENLVRKVDDIISKYYPDPNLSIHVIADQLDMSPAYLRRLFKKITAKSVSEYINDYRTEVAARLLKTTNLTFKEITESIGVSSNPYFYTIFKKKFGMTPAEYKHIADKPTVIELKDIIKGR